MKTDRQLEKEFNINCTSLNEARELFKEITPSIQEMLLNEYGDSYEIVIEELGDISAAVSGMTTTNEKDASLIQNFFIFKGWKEGANLNLFWRADAPTVLKLRAGEHAKIRERMFYYFTIIPGMGMVLLNLFSLKLKLFKMLLWGVGGFAGGALAYLIFAYPILKIITRETRATSLRLSSEIFERAILLIENR